MFKRLRETVKKNRERRAKVAREDRIVEWYNLPSYQDCMLICQFCCKPDKGYVRHIYKEIDGHRFSKRCCSWCYVDNPKMVKTRFKMMWDAQRPRNEHGEPV